MPRYAAICRGEPTAHVLTAWDSSRREGLKAMVAARAASGVSPPDLPGLLTWGEVMGAEEATALFATAARLELTIAAGDYTPGARGWRTAAERAATAFLVAPRDDLDGDCWLQRIHAERMRHWARSRGRPRGPLTAALATKLSGPAPIPAQAEELLAPVRWLLGKAAAQDGAALTQSHTLARAVVAEGCQRFGWLTLTGRPRSESDIVEAWTLRAIIRDLGAVRRHRRRLLLTPAGKRLAAASTTDLWSAVMPLVVPADRAEAAAAEIALMLLLTSENIGYSELTATVAEAMAAEGWHSPDSGEPIGTAAAGWLLGELHRRMRVLNLIERSPAAVRADRLSAPGRAAALTALRARALSPRSNVGPG
jgi:hypothetical protein